MNHWNVATPRTLEVIPVMSGLWGTWSKEEITETGDHVPPGRASSPNASSGTDAERVLREWKRLVFGAQNRGTYPF